jgi:DNA-binding Lrp family transcriptional regulator
VDRPDGESGQGDDRRRDQVGAAEHQRQPGEGAGGDGGRTFKASASKMPEVLSVFVLAGGDDFLLHVGVPDLDALHAFLLDRLSKRREVTGFRTSVIFQQVSNPVPSLLPGLPREPAAGK